MDDLIEKIKAYLEKNPDSTARVICRSIGVDKHYVNSCLYSNEDVHFIKEGMAPPLWRNSEKAPAITRKDEPPILARLDKLDRQLESMINRREMREIREERVLGGDAWNSLDAVLGAEDESPHGPDTDLSVQDLLDDRD
jgi:hypothetical protein